MILIGAGHERPGVLSFPVGARSCLFPDGGPHHRGNARAYKVLDAVLLRRRRGPFRTETLVWRVVVRGAEGSDAGPRGGYPAETYPDRHGAFVDFYSG